MCHAHRGIEGTAVTEAAVVASSSFCACSLAASAPVVVANSATAATNAVIHCFIYASPACGVEAGDSAIEHGDIEKVQVEVGKHVGERAEGAWPLDHEQREAR